jgi:uncharacterized membrane protein YuzA (DUF378 family)
VKFSLLNLVIISSVIIGILGFFSLYVAFELKKEVFGMSPDSYLALGFGIIIGMTFLLPISCFIPSESKNQK